MSRRRTPQVGKIGTWVLMFQLGAVGCSDPDGLRPASLSTGTPLSVSDSSVLSLGVIEGNPDQEFFRVGNPFLLDDGRVAVPLGAGPEVRVFDRNGRLSWSMGRRGSGPGELGALTGAWPLGDSIIEVIDIDEYRVTRFTESGTNEIVRLEAPGRLYAGAPGRQGAGWLALSYVAPSGWAGGDRELLALHAFSSDGSHRGKVTEVGGFLRVSAPGIGGPHPLTPRLVLRRSAAEVWFADSSESTIWRISDRLEPETVIALDLPDPGGVGDALRAIASAIDQRPDAIIPAEAVLRLLDSAAAVPLSTLWDFHADPVGYVWVLPFDPARHSIYMGDLGGTDALTSGSFAGGEWLVYDLSGNLVSEISIPVNVRISQITETEMVTVRRDEETGVEFVEIRKLVRH